MKATQEKPPQRFYPVTLTLESQEEIDALYAILVTGGIENALPALKGAWRSLDMYTSDNTQHCVTALHGVMR